MAAWRRGLLKDGYKYGMRSMIRERMVLGMVDDELTAETYKDSVMMTAALLSSHSAGKPMRELYDNLADRLEFSVYKKEYSPRRFRTLTMKREEAVKNAAAMFAALRKSGIIEEFDRKAREAYNRVTGGG